jgi:hypothetical protein
MPPRHVFSRRPCDRQWNQHLPKPRHPSCLRGTISGPPAQGGNRCRALAACQPAYRRGKGRRRVHLFPSKRATRIAPFRFIGWRRLHLFWQGSAPFLLGRVKQVAPFLAAEYTFFRPPSPPFSPKPPNPPLSPKNNRRPSASAPDGAAGRPAGRAREGDPGAVPRPMDRSSIHFPKSPRVPISREIWHLYRPCVACWFGGLAAEGSICPRNRSAQQGAPRLLEA